MLEVPIELPDEFKSLSICRDDVEVIRNLGALIVEDLRRGKQTKSPMFVVGNPGEDMDVSMWAASLAAGVEEMMRASYADRDAIDRIFGQLEDLSETILEKLYEYKENGESLFLAATRRWLMENHAVSLSALHFLAEQHNRFQPVMLDELYDHVGARHGKGHFQPYLLAYNGLIRIRSDVEAEQRGDKLVEPTLLLNDLFYGGYLSTH